MADLESPCRRCGACCASYRVSFYWAEAGEGGIPARLTEQRDPWRACMAGTSEPSPRCVALEGTVGERVGCTIYAGRPSPCRELQVGDAQCAKARRLHGLAPLPDPERP